MSRTEVAVLSIQRREQLYARVRDLVIEQEAIDRSLESVGEAVSGEEALERIVAMLAVELNSSTTRRQIPTAA